MKKSIAYEKDNLPTVFMIQPLETYLFYKKYLKLQSGMRTDEETQNSVQNN